MCNLQMAYVILVWKTVLEGVCLQLYCGVLIIMKLHKVLLRHIVTDSFLRITENFSWLSNVVDKIVSVAIMLNITHIA